MPLVTCEFCRKQFEKYAAHIKRTKKHFCSNFCQGRYESNMNVLSFIGKKYGELKILEYSGSDYDNRSLVRCICSCGRETIKPLRNIVKGSIKRCGT